MPRKRLEVFVNRKKEIEELLAAIDVHSNTLVLGLRGYGKSTLASKVAEICASKNTLVGYIDCQRVITPMDLLNELKKDLSLIHVEINVPQVDNARDSIENLFSLCEKMQIKALFVDEFTSLLRKFGRFSPFKDSGGVRSLAEFLRSMIEDSKITIIALDTSIKSVYDLILNYTSPLLRVFHKVIFLDPLPAEHAAELIERLMKLRRKSIAKNVAKYVAEKTYCVPQYIDIITRSLPDNPSLDDVNHVLIDELSRGFLNLYFEAFFDKFSDEEKAVLYAISRGRRSYSEIAKTCIGINVSRALNSLVKSRIVAKIEKSRRRVIYIITDKLFEAWLKLREVPELREDVITRLILSTVSFESYVREILRFIPKSAEITDVLGRKFVLGPFIKVERYCGKLGEIDAIALHKDKSAVVFECYFGNKAKKEKLNELLNNVNLAKKLGYNVKFGVLISYFGFSKQVLEECSKRNDIFLIDKTSLRKLAKISGLFAL